MVELQFLHLNRSELNREQEKVVQASYSTLDTSYSPYSSLQVGAALLLANGRIIIGSNQENMAYPSGMCAERSALFTYGSGNNKSPIIKLAVVARLNSSDDLVPGAPCGACRQVMLEYELRQDQKFEVLFYHDNQFVIASSASTLLPYHFLLTSSNK